MFYFVQNLEHIWVLLSTMSTMEYILSTMLLGSLNGRNPSQVGYSLYLSIHQALLYLKHFLMFGEFPTFCSRAHLALLWWENAICPFFQPPLQLQYGHMTQAPPIHVLDFPLLKKIMAMVAAVSGSQRQQESIARAALRSSIRIGRRQGETGTQWCPPGSSSVAWIWA